MGLELSPTLRIVDRIKKIRNDLLLVAFKLEFGLTQRQLINEAKKLSKRSQADLVVVNTFAKKRYSARITDSMGRILAEADSKIKMARKLLGIIKGRL